MFDGGGVCKLETTGTRELKIYEHIKNLYIEL